MPSRFLIWFAGALIAMAAVTAQVRDSRTTSDSGISRRLVIDEKTVQVVRSTYKSGALEPPGPPHSFDVVLVPLTAGDMRVEIAGKTVAWKVGEPIFIPRGAEHSLANRGETAVDLVSIRIP
jgi:mannose-6-phosphate isomerase-like protein (cupin superfamily)